MYDIFLSNNFTEEYKQLIAKAKSRIIMDEVIEHHHIIPKSLGGTEDLENLVQLSPSEHLKAHELLVDMVEGANKAKMSYAYWMMINVMNKHQQRVKVTPEEFETAKFIRKQIEISKVTREKIRNSRKGKIAMFNSRTSTLRYVSENEIDYYLDLGFTRGGKPKSTSHKSAISRTNKERGIVPKSIGWNKGLTKETSPIMARVSESLKGGPSWNSGISNSGFGDPSRSNPMKDPAKIAKMLKTRKNNKDVNRK